MASTFSLSRDTTLRLAIMSVASLEYLQNGMLNFAAAPVMGGLGAGPEEYSYAAMAYALCAVLALFNHRWCAERFGSRRFVRLSLLLFAVGALCCACAQTSHAFILGRAIQGVGGATFFTAARVEIQRLQGRARMFTLLMFGYALLLGSALGPLLGGLALQYANWRWIFWGMMPWLVLAACASGRLHQDTAPQPSRYHYGAFLWLIVLAFLLQFLIQRTPYDYFGRPGLLLALLFAGLAAAIVFRRRHRRSATDGGRWRALAQSRYLTGLVFYGICYFLVAANSYIMPLMVQQALGFDVPTTGLLLATGYLAGTVFATLYARLLLSRGFKPGLRSAMITACVLLVAYGYLMAGLSPEASFGRIAALLTLNGGFMSLFISAVAQGTFQSVEDEVFAHAYQTKNIVRQITLSAAISVSTVFLQARNALHYSRLVEGFVPGNPVFEGALQQWQHALPQLGQGQIVALLGGELIRQAMMVSCLDFFRLECWIGIAMVLWIALQKRFY